ncbi:sigma-54-dependent transcriptional regulator [Pseudoalteromonas xiamenensis]|uniref:Sigma-54-dependent Fis family transcriptional regulator n=1 Tax=Pseudoalteromonas xiamenensis TaxID=882626 RepID=A0A975HPR0_9GAMM|nr:sigma-54 dependent transcriptional regulator [Pseudoalteromonas xiamenensis]QTH73510.1 sigma-54-dependent Fis family transcriptional regulator [Pseudoalteromonas xiamenensis]
MTVSNLLLVDDDLHFSELMSIRLESLGYQVFVAHRATLALSILQKQRIDVVLTDLRMEHMDGMALFQEIKKRFSALPVIMMTAHGSIPDAIAATEQGIAGFLTKPVDISALQDLLNTVLKARPSSESASQPGQFFGLYYESDAMHTLVHKLEAIARSKANIMIQGESGTGKEVTAKAIHSASEVASGPFVAINCGAVPANLLESELFGHFKGAFTGATKDKIGLVQAADNGTLFLDEIADMPLELQVKLLRVLQERKVRPIGGQQEYDVNVRVLSASHKNLWDAVQNGLFREDLYYRLNVISVTLPSLKERPEDIPLLANHFLTSFGDKSFSPEAMTRLLNYDWPGNIRQLHNVVEHCAVLTPSKLITDSTVESALPVNTTAMMQGLNEAKAQFEYDYLQKVLALCQGNVAQAAVVAKRNRSDFYKLLKKHNIAPS